MSAENENQDRTVVRDFGREWSTFDQSGVTDDEHRRSFDAYFEIFPWQTISDASEGFDLGCGSGRYAKFVARRVGRLHCIDASADAISVAQRNLAGLSNCVFHTASVERMPLTDQSMDFGYSLGVLHHVPDTALGLAQCVRKLKPGAPFLLYLYYRFDNRPPWFSTIWRATDLGRRIISRLPFRIKRPVTDAIALTVYLPLARIAHLAEKLHFPVDNLPLSAYRNGSFYTMRTDALDRFGTRLEKRFTRPEIQSMLEQAGLEGIVFGSKAYWVAVGYKS